MRYLDNLPEVGTTELIPLADRRLIIVFLREPLHLIEIVRTLPEVGLVKKVMDQKVVATTGTAHTEDTRRKIQITFPSNYVLDEAKEKVDGEVSHTLS